VFRKHEEMQQDADAILSQRVEAEVRILTSCPACLQALARYRDNVGVDADYIVGEMTKHQIGPN
jgi:Fe-S oxidoreductase